MTQESSSTLVLLSVKQSYCENLDCNHIINDSTEIWARKAGLWKFYYGTYVYYSCKHHLSINRTPTNMQLYLSSFVFDDLTFGKRKPIALDIFLLHPSECISVKVGD